MSIVFQNPGVIDVRAVTTFGINSKENPGAIGHFGTGLKYAIAILLREGCRVTIYAGPEKLEFSSRAEKVRVDHFDIVTMNGQPLGFTTDVGKEWELWQAFRELYCNCVDERGHVHETEGHPEPIPGHTIVVVDGDAFRDVWLERNSIILNTVPLERHEAVDIHPGPSHYVYYRGVRALTLSTPSKFCYNIKRKVDLTEDRTIKYKWDVDAAIRAGLCESSNEHLIEMAVTAPKEETLEGELNFEGVAPSKTFQNVVVNLAKAFNSDLNATAFQATKIFAMDDLHEEGTLMRLTDVETEMLRRAKEFCEKIGFPVTDYPIILSDFLGDNILGRAHNGKIYVSKRALLAGTKMLAGTLIEEFLHLRHNLRDYTPVMQNFLIDQIATLGERLVGEPL